MNGIDATIVHAINAYAARSPIIDTLITRILDLPSIKMLPLVAVVWALWFDSADRDRSRQRMLQAFVGAFIALVLSQLMQEFGPFRSRPLHTPELGFTLPFGVDKDNVRQTSSFPSDHAALAFALSAGIFAASKALGVLALLLSFVTDGFARIYAGYHYPTDVAAGALLGIVATAAVVRMLPAKRAQAMLSRAEQRSPRLFYFFAFCFAYQIVSMFWDPRFGAGLIGQAVNATPR
jgi:undecaprenyl-diphosphatase